MQFIRKSIGELPIVEKEILEISGEEDRKIGKDETGSSETTHKVKWGVHLEKYDDLSSKLLQLLATSSLSLRGFYEIT